jgi:hypothetical protein
MVCRLSTDRSGPLGVLTYSEGLVVLCSEAHARILSVAGSVEWPAYIDEICVSLLCHQAVTSVG